jgi:hypothetical protein
VREGRAEVGAVDRAVPIGLGRVDVFAAGAVELDGFLVRHVRESHGEKRLRVAVDARTSSKVCFAVFLELTISLGDISGNGKALTIFASPREVMIYRACIKPYRNRAEVSMDSRTSSSRRSSSAR